MAQSKISELEQAIETASACELEEIRAYISKTTCEVVYDDEEMSGEKCPIEDIESNDDYIRVPDKRELDLGQSLVWKFVDREILEHHEKVREIFSRRGAYRRYKDFLEYNDLLEKWYDFEQTELQRALLEWCDENKIPIRDKSGEPEPEKDSPA